MKKVKVLISSVTLVVAVAGILVTKANENKRTVTPIGFIVTSAGIIQVTLDYAVFDNASISNTTKIIDNNGNQHQIFANSNLTQSLKLIP